MTCDHKFVDSDRCGKCGKSAFDLTMEQLRQTTEHLQQWVEAGRSIGIEDAGNLKRIEHRLGHLMSGLLDEDVAAGVLISLVRSARTSDREGDAVGFYQSSKKRIYGAKAYGELAMELARGLLVHDVSTEDEGEDG